GSEERLEGGDRQVLFDEREGGIPEQQREVALLQRPVEVVGEAIRAHDLVAAGDEVLAECRTDESSRSGDESPHWAPPRPAPGDWGASYLQVDRPAGGRLRRRGEVAYVFRCGPRIRNRPRSRFGHSGHRGQRRR